MMLLWGDAMKRNLTAVALSSLKPKTTAYYVSDMKQDGLRVRIAPSGLLTWNVTCRIRGGGLKSISLGRCDPDGRQGMDLASARDRAAAIVKAARGGHDLIADEKSEKQAATAALTIGGMIELYGKSIASPNRAGGALRTANEIERRLKRALANKLDEPVNQVSRGDISRLLDAVSEKHPREAEKRRQSLHAMYSWALGKGYSEANPLAGSPTYGSGKPRDRSLSSDEIRTLWKWLGEGADFMPPDAIAVLKLQLCTGARVGEVSGIVANELAVEADKIIWTLPAARSKNKKERITPLVGTAREIASSALQSRPAGALFRTVDEERALRSDDMGLALNHRTRPIAHFTTHDIRRTVVSGMDELGIPLDTIAAVIGHQRGGKATQTLVRHYSRPNLDAKVEAALTAWNDHLSTIIVKS